MPWEGSVEDRLAWPWRGSNPHCGEGGLFGSEDDDESAPAVLSAKAKGILVEGPLPADTIFSKMKGGQFDAVIVMYHDQGHIPMKLSAFSTIKRQANGARWLA